MAEDTTVILDAQAEELLLDQKKAEARKAIAEAKQAELATIIPDVTEAMKPGALDPGDAGSPVAAAVGYELLCTSADEIADKVVATCEKKPIILVSDLSLIGYRDAKRVIATQINDLKQRCTEAKELLSRGPDSDERIPTTDDGLKMVAVSIAVPVMAAAALLPPVLSLLKTDTTIRARDFTVTDNALKVAMFTALKKKEITARILKLDKPSTTGVLATAGELRACRHELATAIREYHAKYDTIPIDEVKATQRLKLLELEFNAALGKTNGDSRSALEPIREAIIEVVEKIAQSKRNRGEAKARAEHAESVLSATDALLTQLDTPTASGITPLELAAQAESVLSSGSILVYVEASVSGGESTYESKALRKEKVSHAGVLVLTYVVFRSDGTIIASGIMPRVGIKRGNVGDTVSLTGSSTPSR